MTIPNERERRLALWAYATSEPRRAHAQRLASYREEILSHFDALRRQLAMAGVSGEVIEQIGATIEHARGRESALPYGRRVRGAP